MQSIAYGMGPDGQPRRVSVTAWRNGVAVSHAVGHVGGSYGPFERGDLLQVTPLTDEYLDLRLWREVFSVGPHDDRATPQDLPDDFLIADSNTGATAPPGETIAGRVSSRSLWYRWTVTTPRRAVLSVRGASTRLQVLRGSTPACTPVEIAVSEPLSNLVQCAIDLTPGTYEIGVGGLGSTYGTFYMSATTAPETTRTSTPGSGAAPPTAPRRTTPSSPGTPVGGRGPSSPAPLS